jgi:acetyl-CoA synthetase
MRMRRIELAELPKTTSGKIRRGELRGAEHQRGAHPSACNANEWWEEDFRELKDP